MIYKNIHEYLDEVLKGIAQPTTAQIIEAKRTYYKLWHKHYNRKRRASRKEFTLGFNSLILQKIKEKKGNLTISKFLYQIIYNSLEATDISHYDNEVLIEVKRYLMQISMLLEELLENDLQQYFEIILTKVEKVEELVSKVK